MTFSVKLRPKIAKLLLKLPKRFFPDYRVVVNATLIDRNRRTLLDTQVSDFSSSSSSESSAAERRRCCRYCKRLYDSLEELDVEERTSSTPLSTVKLSWCEEVERELSHQNEIPTPPPMPSSFLTPKATPSGRRLTLDDIGSVKLKPIPIKLPQTPEIHDLMDILRKRFAALHSPLFRDDSSVRNDSDDDDYADFVDQVWTRPVGKHSVNQQLSVM